jgi:transcriptional regulator
MEWVYVPQHFVPTDDQLQALLSRPPAGELITPTAEGLQATLLPWLHRPDADGQSWGSLVGHLARNNPHAAAAPTGESLVILRGPDAYVTPRWYASKAEHGRVVPTWNYLTCHAHGKLIIHDDLDWLDAHVRRLTDHHETQDSGSERPWSVDDAPQRFVSGQLRAIVGVELVITRLEAKAKLSQNRPQADIDGVIDGLGRRGDATAADAVRSARRPGR